MHLRIAETHRTTLDHSKSQAKHAFRALAKNAKVELRSYAEFAKLSLEILIGDKWKKARELFEAIEVERIRDGLAREGKEMRGTIDSPAWVREILPRLSNVDRDKVMLAVQLSITSCSALREL